MPRAKGIGAELIDRFVADLRGIGGSEQLKNLAKQTGAQLVLHGHQHASDENPLTAYCHALSAGSLCLVTGELPADEPLSYRLVELVHGRPEAQAWLFIYSPRAMAEGRVERGAFLLDNSEKQPYVLPIQSPPAREESAAASGVKLRTEHEAFLRVYRQAFEVDFDRWDLSASGVPKAGGFRKEPATLDTMYLPLRLADGWNSQKLDEGEALTPEGLLERTKALLIRGQAGAGKTTWMRYTYRRLIRDPRAFPLILVLRDLALSWKPEVKGEDRSLLVYLENKIGERLAGQVPGGSLKLQPFLAAESGPRPVLLVDGWDEIGPIGESVRDKLRSLMSLHPRLLVVVTSRPYDAGGRPSHGDQFEGLDVQPLNDEEIRHLSTHFFGHLHGADEARCGDEVALFERALERSEEARDLGRTPLLLTMMLGIHSVEPLPDKRHRLYEACVRNLMANLPERKAEEGARVGLDQWCPPGSEERFQIVARLAFELQGGGYEKGGRRAIVSNRPQLVKLLPSQGPWQGKQEYFLNWLVGTAGLLTDRADDGLAFSHLSFQEYLAAHHLKATLADEKKLCQLATHGDWWETLVLWAALAGGESTDRATRMVEVLLSSEDYRPRLLAGMMLADGLGTEEQLDKWAVVLVRYFDDDQSKRGSEEYRVARAFADTRQEARRKRLLQALNANVAKAGWFLWKQLRSFVWLVDRAWHFKDPENRIANAFECQLAGRPENPTLHAAVARCLAGLHPL